MPVIVGREERRRARKNTSAILTDFAHFFDYLVAARRLLFEWIAGGPPGVYVRPYGFGLGSIRATLLHVAEVEWGYTQRLEGKDHPKADAPLTEERLPELPSLVDAWERQRADTRRALAAAGADPERRIEYVSRNFTPPRHIRTTASGIAWQMLFHEVHHRAQVMAMLRLAGVPAQDLDYRRLMWDRRPEKP